MKSPITNRWGQVPVDRIKADHFVAFRGYEGAAYNHHHQIASLNGRLYLSWSNGVVHEDAPGQRMLMATSDDAGETWSEPVLTEFTDANCRFHFGRLPDGRYFAVSCPGPGSPRTPLILAISEDGVVFDRHFLLGGEPDVPPRLKGHHKGGRYGYPTYHIIGDTLFVAYSMSKEDIAVCRLSLNDLG